MAEVIPPSGDEAEESSAKALPQGMDFASYSQTVQSQWNQLLSSGPEEVEVQEFLELHPAMVPGGSGDIGPGGHHGAELGALFRQPLLQGEGSVFRPDFMWVTRSTGQITPILIEIEKPSKQFFNLNGVQTAAYTQALSQLNDWRAWFERGNNKEVFRKMYLHTGQYEHRILRPQFLLIYGRSDEFVSGGKHKNADALRYKRDLSLRHDEYVMTFDSLRPKFDHSSSVTVTVKSDGLCAYAFSPLYEIDPETGFDAMILGDPEEALGRTVMMAPERKAYIDREWRCRGLKEMQAQLRFPGPN